MSTVNHEGVLSGRGDRILSLLPLLPACGLLLDTLVALGFGWQPVGWFELGGVFVVLLAGAALLLLFWSPVRDRYADWRHELAVLVVALVFATALVETGTHLVNQRLEVRRTFHTRGPNINAMIAADRDALPGISGPARFTTDRLGIRALALPAREQTERWLAVGGSTTECVYLDDAKTWPWRTAELLNNDSPEREFWIGNAGISGFDTRQHLRMIEDGSLLAGVDGLLIQPGINDLWRFAANEETLSVRGRFGNGLKIRMPRLELEPSPDEPYRPYWARSRTVQLLRTLRALRDPYQAAAPEGEGGREYVVRRAARVAAEKVDDSPDWERGALEYKERLERLTEEARARGLKLVFVSQPVLWSNPSTPEAEERCWMGWRQDWKYWKLETLADGLALYNQTLQEVCQEQGIPCVDLSSLNGRPEYFYDDCHYTEAGAEAVAQKVAPVLALTATGRSQ